MVKRITYYVVGIILILCILQLLSLLFINNETQKNNYLSQDAASSQKAYLVNEPLKIVQSVHKKNENSNENIYGKIISLNNNADTDSFQNDVSIALVFHDISDQSQKSLVTFFKYMQTNWSNFKFYILTHAPKLTRELIDSNNIKNNIDILTNHIPKNYMGPNFGKSHIYKIFEQNSNLKEILFIDHRFNIFEKTIPIVQSSRSNCQKNILLFRNGNQSKFVLSSKVMLVKKDLARDFFRLWGNFMETMSFHKKSNDEEALDFTFFAEGYSDVDKMISTLSHHEPLDYCLVKNLGDYLVDTGFTVSLPNIVTKIYSSADEPEPEPFKGLVDMNGEPMDYLIAIKVVSCTAKQAVEHINKFQNPQRILYMVVFAHTCRTLLSFGENVRCIWENHVIPGFSKKVIQQHSTKDKIKERAGWYLLQMMNLHASFLEGFAEHYVVWDADGVPIYKIPHIRNGKVVFYTGDEHDKYTSIGYHRSYTQLTGYPPMDPLDDVSPEWVQKGRPTWVAHFMVFRRTYARELLYRIAENRKVPVEKWMFEVIKVINAHQDQHLQRVGFGEYDAYGFFVKKMHPDSFEFEIDSWKTCNRMFHEPQGYKKDCCVPEEIIEESTKKGFHYIVREYGGNCDMTNAN